MTETLHSRDRIPVVAAFIAPVVGFPLLGPWILNASVAEDSPAKSHIARAFDLHLMTLLTTVATWFLSAVIWGLGTAEMVAAAVLVAAFAASLVLLVGIVRGARWSAPWEPIFLSKRKFYHQAPFNS